MPLGKSSCLAVWDTKYLRRRISRALFLTAESVGNSHTLSMNSATIDAHGYVINVHLPNLAGVIFAYRRGVNVARFDKVGNPTASAVERATSSLHAFFVSWDRNVNNQSFRDTIWRRSAKARNYVKPSSNLSSYQLCFLKA